MGRAFWKCFAKRVPESGNGNEQWNLEVEMEMEMVMRNWKYENGNDNQDDEMKGWKWKWECIPRKHSHRIIHTTWEIVSQQPESAKP